MAKPTESFPASLKSLVILLLIICIVFILIIGKNIFIPLFLAGLFSIILTPLGEQFEKWGLGRTNSTILTVLSGLITILLILGFSVLQVVSFRKDLENVGEKLNAYLQSFDSFIFERFNIETGLGEGIDQAYLIDLIESNGSTIAQVILGTIGSLSSFILLPIFIFFFLLYRGHLTEFFVKLLSNQNSEKVKTEIKELRKLIQNYIVGVLKVMFILAVLNSIALFSLGIKHAIFFAVFAAILNIIPYLGPLMGAVLPTVFAFLTKDGLFYPIAVVACFQLIQLIESNFLTPKIVGSNVNLNAFVTFLGLLVGASIWGIAGMIIIIPTMAILRKIFELTDSTKPYAFLLGEEETKKSEDTT
ncbi:AI-2E family transporter [Mongoliitalea daihaiensis]|uniref:AI-2E family transporter n=1 Tax=Mongoliitalea daihaiensis TaxID=2782006 RepID=UPI001F3FCAF8|nr:AI-2E family transporter [Mongoliitalea daihaiensis]UJP64821.1 AI-2E family transporter [Mongoliitalea daihaiensis]